MEHEQVRKIAEEVLEKFNCFLIELSVSKNQEICVVADCDTSLSIDTCSEISKEIELRLDREKEDFELTVMSAGIGEALKLPRQYRKIVSKSINILKQDGTKILAKLDDVTEKGIIVSYDEKVLHEGEKRRRLEHISLQIPFEEIKKASEYIDFK